jgi:type I restriction enzyme R subunit
VDRDKAKVYFENLEGESIPAFHLSIKIDKLLKDFILSGGFDINEQMK